MGTIPGGYHTMGGLEVAGSGPGTGITCIIHVGTFGPLCFLEFHLSQSRDVHRTLCQNCSGKSKMVSIKNQA